MSEVIRVGVVGYGLAGRVFHCPFVSAVPGLSLEAIVQRSGESAAEVYPQARILRSAEEAIGDPAIDLIVVATPNETHEELARKALAAGKHVVVDKPLAPTAEAIRGLIATAHAAGKKLIPFHNRRWDGDFLTLQALVGEGKLGRVVKVSSHMDRYRPLRREGTWKEQGGEAQGLLQDLGPHLLDQAVVLFGMPQRLTASVRRDREGTAVEDAFDVVLTYDRDGHELRFEVHGTMLAADPAPRFRAHGTAGSYTKFGLDPQEPHLVAEGRHPPQMGSSVPWIAEAESAWGVLTKCADPEKPGELTRTAVPTWVGDYRLFYAGVRDALLGKGEVPVRAEDALRVAELIALARRSSAEGRTVEVVLG